MIGGDDISHDSTEEKENHMEYHYTWFTNGYTSTKSGQRLDLAVVFLFEGAELRTKFQVSGRIFLSEVSVFFVDFILRSGLLGELCGWLRGLDVCVVFH